MRTTRELSVRPQARWVPVGASAMEVIGAAHLVDPTTLYPPSSWTFTIRSREAERRCSPLPSVQSAVTVFECAHSVWRTRPPDSRSHTVMVFADAVASMLPLGSSTVFDRRCVPKSHDRSRRSRVPEPDRVVARTFEAVAGG